jgi:hypothetical protein
MFDCIYAYDCTVVSKPGEEPSLIKGWENFKDDLNLVDAEIFSNMSSVDRKAYFSKRFVLSPLYHEIHNETYYRENLNKYEFQPDFGEFSIVLTVILVNLFNMILFNHSLHI